MPQSPISVSFSQALHLTSGMCPGNECKVRHRRRPTRRAVSYFASLLRSSASLSSLASSFHAVLYSTPVSQPRAFSLGNYQHSFFFVPFPPFAFIQLVPFNLRFPRSSSMFLRCCSRAKSAPLPAKGKTIVSLSFSLPPLSLSLSLSLSISRLSDVLGSTLHLVFSRFLEYLAPSLYCSTSLSFVSGTVFQEELQFFLLSLRCVTPLPPPISLRVVALVLSSALGGHFAGAYTNVQ